MSVPSRTAKSDPTQGRISLLPAITLYWYRSEIYILVNEESLEDSLEELLEKTGVFLSDSEKTEGETKKGGMDGNKKRSIDGGKRGASIKKSKRMKLLVQQQKLFVLRLIQNLQHHK